MGTDGSTASHMPGGIAGNVMQETALSDPLGGVGRQFAHESPDAVVGGAVAGAV